MDIRSPDKSFKEALNLNGRITINAVETFFGEESNPPVKVLFEFVTVEECWIGLLRCDSLWKDHEDEFSNECGVLFPVLATLGPPTLTI